MRNQNRSKIPFEQQGLFFHASAVNIKGRAVLFFGQSGSGKTTISKLLSEKYPIIADDKAWISKNRFGEWCVCGGFIDINFSKVVFDSIKKKEKYPIHSLVSIHKADSFNIEKMDAIDVCYKLVSSVFEIYIQQAMKDLDIRKKWFSDCSAISKKYQGWRLNFKKNSFIMDYIQKILE